MLNRPSSSVLMKQEWTIGGPRTLSVIWLRQTDLVQYAHPTAALWHVKCSPECVCVSSSVSHPYVHVMRAAICASPESNPLCFLCSSFSDEQICCDWLGKNRNERRGGGVGGMRERTSEKTNMLPRPQLAHFYCP